MTEAANEPNPPDKKLYVDEDWKTQVEREKEAARHEESPADAQPEPSASATGADAPTLPADLLFLIGTFHLQAIIALGLAPNPVSNKVEPNRIHAKHVIDTLAMLQQKTEGNRTTEESIELEGILHELRMAFVTMPAAK
jgi:hypothetical protein